MAAKRISELTEVSELTGEELLVAEQDGVAVQLKMAQLAKKLAPNISVTDYGAKGDGKTDDTAAFQSALAENRVVFVPGGTYVLSGTLTIRANCCLELSQDTVLKFTQTGANCITMLRLASLKGNHATIFVPYTFNANVINCDGGDDYALLDNTNTTTIGSTNNAAVPPFARWDPQWKMSRYVTDINICKPNSEGFHYSNDGTCYGNGIYIHCDEADWPCNYMWGVSMSGVRIAGGFNYGIRIYNIGAHEDSWNHDARIEAAIDACKIAVSVENAYYNRLAVTVQPRKAADGTVYAEHGFQLIDSKGIDLSSSRVWDWNEKNTLWTDGGVYQHLAMYGECRGLILDDFLYYEMSGYDIRSLIYTDTASNLENMTILQEPVTRWFKPVDGEPYFSDGYTEKKLITQDTMDAYFDTDTVKGFTDVLATAKDTDGETIFNGIGYQKGMRFTSWGKDSALTASTYYMVTGFLEVPQGSTVYCKDLKFASIDLSYACIAFYDANREWIANFNIGNIVGNASTAFTTDYAVTDDGCSFKISTGATLTNAGYKYLRICFPVADVGTNPMIAIDEEIKYDVEGFLADGVKVKGENMLLYSPSGKAFRLTVADDGTLSVAAVSV